jgi:hypothetical protein
MYFNTFRPVSNQKAAVFGEPETFLTNIGESSFLLALVPSSRFHSQ